MTQTHSPSAEALTESLQAKAVQTQTEQNVQVLAERSQQTQAATQAQAVQALMQGEAVIFPTDTLFGIGVSVCHAHSPELLYRIKKRDEHKPIAWLVDTPQALDKYGKDIPAYAYTLAKAYWPGPLTLIVKASENVPHAFQSEVGSIGMRMPASTIACNLIAQVGCPLATTSANISGHANAYSFDELESEILAQVPVALSDGETKQGIASTVVDCTQDNAPIIVREGVITKADIKALLSASILA